MEISIILQNHQNIRFTIMQPPIVLQQQSQNIQQPSIQQQFNEVPNEVRTQIGTFIFNEYGNPDFRCTASEWLRRHNFIINSVTKSNIIFHEGKTYFSSRGAILINNTKQKSEHGELIFDSIEKTVLPTCEFGKWLISNKIDPSQITIDNFKFGYKSDQWIFNQPSQNQNSLNNDNDQKQNIEPQSNTQQQSNIQQKSDLQQPSDIQQNAKPKIINSKQKSKFSSSSQQKQDVNELKHFLHQQQMQFIRQMKQLRKMQFKFPVNQMPDFFTLQGTPDANSLQTPYESDYCESAECTENDSTECSETDYTESIESKSTGYSENSASESAENEECESSTQSE